jgi:nucleotide-binding universal stress UspA family protein
MTKIVAAITNDAAAPSVLATAHAIANLYAATVEAVHVGNDDATVAEAARIAGVALRTVAGRPVEALVRAAVDDDVAVIVLGARGAGAGKRPAGSTALQLITMLDKPAVVVPPNGARGRPIERVLVPLDGTAGSAAALAEVVQLACDAAVEIVVAHVHQERALPLFSDHLAHEVRAWGEEFIARNCPAALDATLELRVGEPREHLLDILRRTGCDLVALGWNQDLARGRAAVVRRILAESPVPVLLTPASASTTFVRPAAGAAGGRRERSRRGDSEGSALGHAVG